MPLFAFPAYLKSLKDMRKPGGPQERNTWEACEKQTLHHKLWEVSNETAH